jgi:hypothetical protein
VTVAEIIADELVPLLAPVSFCWTIPLMENSHPGQTTYTESSRGVFCSEVCRDQKKKFAEDTKSGERVASQADQQNFH